jgi:hypothetical protein
VIKNTSVQTPFLHLSVNRVPLCSSESENISTDVLFQGFDGSCKFSAAAMRLLFTIETLMLEIYSDFMTERKESVMDLPSMKEGIAFMKTGISLKQIPLKDIHHLFKCVLPKTVGLIIYILKCFIYGSAVQ